MVKVAAVPGLRLRMGNALTTTAGLVWLAHVGFGRAVGYGRKYPDGFHRTQQW